MNLGRSATITRVSARSGEAGLVMLRQGEGRRGTGWATGTQEGFSIDHHLQNELWGEKKKFSSKFNVSSTPSPHNPVLISVLFTWLNPDSQGAIPRAGLAPGHADTAVNV